MPETPTVAELRLVVMPLAGAETAARRRRVQVELARARGGRSGGTVEIESDSDKGTVVRAVIPADGNHLPGLPARRAVTLAVGPVPPSTPGPRNDSVNAVFGWPVTNYMHI